jgi:hypothetical protein
MVIMGNEEKGENMDWKDENELDLNGISIPQDEEIHDIFIYFIYCIFLLRNCCSSVSRGYGGGVKQAVCDLLCRGREVDFL